MSEATTGKLYLQAMSEKEREEMLKYIEKHGQKEWDKLMDELGWPRSDMPILLLPKDGKN